MFSYWNNSTKKVICTIKTLQFKDTSTSCRWQEPCCLSRLREETFEGLRIEYCHFLFGKQLGMDPEKPERPAFSFLSCTRAISSLCDRRKFVTDCIPLRHRLFPSLKSNGFYSVAHGIRFGRFLCVKHVPGKIGPGAFRAQLECRWTYHCWTGV